MRKRRHPPVPFEEILSLFLVRHLLAVLVVLFLFDVVLFVRIHPVHLHIHVDAGEIAAGQIAAGRLRPFRRRWLRRPVPRFSPRVAGRVRFARGGPLAARPGGRSALVATVGHVPADLTRPPGRPGDALPDRPPRPHPLDQIRRRLVRPAGVVPGRRAPRGFGDGELGAGLGAVPGLGEQVQPVRGVVVVLPERGRLRRGRAGGVHGGDGGALLRRGGRGLVVFPRGRRAHGGAVEIQRPGGGAPVGELLEERLGVGTGGREHRPPAARRQTGAQRGLVRRRETPPDGGIEVIRRVDRAPEHGGAQRSGSQRVRPAVAPGRGGAAQQGGRRRERRDGRQDRLAAGGLRRRVPERLLERIRLEGEMTVMVRSGEVIGFGWVLLMRCWSRRWWWWWCKRLGHIGMGCARAVRVLGWVGWFLDGERGF